MQDQHEAAAIAAQEAAGRAHSELQAAKMAKADAETVARLQDNYDRAEKIEASTWARYARVG